MAEEIAKNLPGSMRRQEGFIETDGGTVTWLFGHVLRQAEPHEYEEKYKHWRLIDLPILPKQWKLLVSENCRKQFSIVKRLVESADEIIHAGDPDREGQLLVDEVLQYVGITVQDKPIFRLLLNALDEQSVKKALSSLRYNHEYYKLGLSAQARQRADWLIGMNMSRYFTLRAHENGHDRAFPVGRVKTPTLALIVRREREIDSFKPVNHFGINVAFNHKNGQFLAKWKIPENFPGLDNEGRLIDEATALEVLNHFRQSAAAPGTIASCSTVKKVEAAPLPPSLSALQIIAGNKFGYSPQEVLDAAQELYEKKLTTYPRSDCDYLPTSQFADASVIIGHLSASLPKAFDRWIQPANPALKSRAWNDEEISAHHAIIPTGVSCDLNNMSEVTRKVYLIIVRAYLAQFHPIHEYKQTSIEIIFDDHTFTTGGNVVITPGWKLMYDDHENEQDDNEDDKEKLQKLPYLQKGDNVSYIEVNIYNKTTKPPKRFTQATLVQAMRHIHKYVKLDNLKKTLQNISGIGTEATRATIIKELLEKKFMEEKNKSLIPTNAAYSLIDALPDELTWPDNTAMLELELEKIVDGQMTISVFMTEQEKLVKRLCSEKVTIKPAEGITCPSCGKSTLRKIKGKNGNFWGCKSYPVCKATYNDKAGKPDLTK